MLVFVVDLPHDLLDEVLQGNEPGGSSKLVEHDGHLDPLGAHLGEEIFNDLATGHKPRRAHDRLDFGSVVASRAPKISRDKNTHHPVDRVLVHRQTKTTLVQHDFLCLVDRSRDRNRHHRRAWRHDLGNLHAIEIHDVGNHLPFVVVDLSLAVSHVSENFQLRTAHFGHRFPPWCDQPIEVGQRDEDRLHHLHHPTQDVCGWLGESLPMVCAERLRENLRKHQDGQRQQRREKGNPSVAEYLKRERSAHRGTNRVPDGIEGQYRRDGFVDVVAHAREHVTQTLIALLKHRNE